MLRLSSRRYEPGNFWQRAIGDVSSEGADQIGYVYHAAIVQGVARRSISVLYEPGQSVVVEVIGLLIDSPAYARSLQPFWISGPSEARLGIVDNRSAAGAVGVDHASHGVEAFWIGRAHY